jgi:nitroreductase
MIDAIAKRYSCRAYKDEPIDEDVIEEIVTAGMRAPSAVNRRPWHIIVVTDAELREQLAAVHPYAGFCGQAPVVFVIAAEPAEADDAWIEDCSALVENMLLQAAEFDLATCWVGLRGNDELGYDAEDRARAILGIPEGIRLLAQVPCGHPATPGQCKPPGPMANVHRNGW